MVNCCSNFSCASRRRNAFSTFEGKQHEKRFAEAEIAALAGLEDAGRAKLKFKSTVAEPWLTSLDLSAGMAAADINKRAGMDVDESRPGSGIFPMDLSITTTDGKENAAPEPGSAVWPGWNRQDFVGEGHCRRSQSALLLNFRL